MTRLDLAGAWQVTAKGRLAPVEAAFAKWYQLHDLEVLEVLLAVVLAHQLSGDPLWLFLVASPGSLKTELIRALMGIPCIYALSNLTAQTFASGYQTKEDGEPSLLKRIDGKILVMKDFTTVLTMHREKRSEILAQLREIYDGTYRKEFGNGKVVDWMGKLGFIAGVTPIIDTYTSVSQVLGERCLLYRLTAPDPRAVARRSMQQQGDEPEMRREVREAFATFIATHPATPPPSLPPAIVEQLAALAVYTAKARSSVLWDARAAEIEYVPEAEGPGRLAKQFATLARGLALVRTHATVTPADYATVYRVAHDTVAAPRIRILDYLARPQRTDLLGERTLISTPLLAAAVGYPTPTARRYLLELHAMQLVDREPGHTDRWQLSALGQTLLTEAAPSGV